MTFTHGSASCQAAATPPLHLQHVVTRALPPPLLSPQFLAGQGHGRHPPDGSAGLRDHPALHPDCHRPGRRRGGDNRARQDQCPRCQRQCPHLPEGGIPGGPAGERALRQPGGPAPGERPERLLSSECAVGRWVQVRSPSIILPVCPLKNALCFAAKCNRVWCCSHGLPPSSCSPVSPMTIWHPQDLGLLPGQRRCLRVASLSSIKSTGTEGKVLCLLLELLTSSAEFRQAGKIALSA